MIQTIQPPDGTHGFVVVPPTETAAAPAANAVAHNGSPTAGERVDSASQGTTPEAHSGQRATSTHTLVAYPARSPMAEMCTGSGSGVAESLPASPPNSRPASKSRENRVMEFVLKHARAWLAKQPPAISGKGGHNQTFAVTCGLKYGFMLDDCDVRALLDEYNRRCVPPWDKSSLDHKVETAQSSDTRGRGYYLRYCYEPPSKTASAPKKAVRPKDPLPYINSFLNGFTCDIAAIRAASPVAVPDDPKEAAALFIERLYEPGEFINFVSVWKKEEDAKVHPNGVGLTQPREALVKQIRSRGVPQGQAGARLRMNPTDGKGIADENILRFRYALVELDKVALELQVALVARLPLPIAAVLSSGGRSIHAWVKVDCTSREQYDTEVTKMLRLLAKFWVDQNNSNPSRMSRFPGAKRTLGAVGDGIQRLYYVNQNPQERSIL